ncbi:PREDICTED: uncharacterized protein LOC109177187 [Ipomoea nil]|uniref:uncharacterized protein LOC109177187 n=1 Tax=Ipomoea nil TaxID=35883 RepID=UPI0009012BB1|nr:PREDICTED: uncharacterized protein LOC109177187 [Ipomoea nil]
MGGFYGRSNYEDIAVVEAEAIAKGLAWAWQIGIREVQIQSDAKRVIQWITNGSTLRGPIGAHIEEVRQWLKSNWKANIRTVFREQNESADTAASLGIMMNVEWKEFERCPPGMEEIVDPECMHAIWSRSGSH